jgi:hypothetical protein
MDEENLLPSGEVPQVVNSKITDIAFWVDDPNECTEATGSFANTHIPDEF